MILPHSKSTANVCIASLLVVFTVIVLRNAWVGDDAYITFRTVDNFVNGYGLTWNVIERVQAYTNPLWMLLLSLFYSFTREVYFTSIVLSVVLSVIAVWVVATRIAVIPVAACLAIATLTLSKAFVDFSTSGMENPLTHMIAVLFMWVYFSHRGDRNLLGLLSLLAALGACNRMDSLLLYVPALLYLLWKDRTLKGLLTLIVGFVPFLLWELFSLFYYGFLFPNTAYAKLSTGISRFELIQQGLYYLWSAVTVDPLTPTIVLLTIVVTVATKRKREMAMVGGVILYLLYVVWIGGCFMGGRHLAAPFLVSIALLARQEMRGSRIRWAVPAVVILLLGLCSGYSPVYSGADYGTAQDIHDFGRGIIDERACYYPASGLLNARSDREMPDHDYADLGKTQNEPLILRSTIGYYGFYAGPGTHVVDINALADPLLARLPVDTTAPWRIGHFSRELPAGYGLTLKTGKNSLRNESLARYYDRLLLVTRGDLWNRERLKTIVLFNLGLYDHLLEEYVAKR